MPGIKVLVTSWFEPELLAAIEAVDPRVSVLFDEALVPVPRYPADHGGIRPELDDAAQARWLSLLGRADVCLDIDWQDPAGLPVRAPNLRWVQATSAGIGQYLARTGLDRCDIVFTTAAGVHGAPLAEFALTGVLHFVKSVPTLQARQRDHHWERHPTRGAAGLRAVVIGLGSLGSSTCRLLDAVGLSVTGVGRPGRSYQVPGAAAVVGTDALDGALAGADVVVLACPLTAQTRHILDARRLALLTSGAIVVNIARGPCLDTEALLGALDSGQVGGAALDVFEVEPLPADSPLWDRPEVLISPHSASTLPGENAAITDLFTRNLRAWLDDEPLINVYRRDAGY